MYLQLAAGVSTERPAPDWFVWRNGDRWPPFVWSAGGQGDFLRVTSGSVLPLLGDSSRSGWWKRLWTREGDLYIGDYKLHHFKYHLKIISP